MATMSNLTTASLAEALFASPLQESDHPSPAQLRAAIETTLAACGGECACAACVAQEAGDHPELFVTRMHWALRMVSGLYDQAGAQAA